MPAQEKQISREYRIYLALWRKALTGAPIIVKCPSRSIAIAMRQGMYRAIRPFRNGELFDDDLQKAAEKFVVYLAEDSLEFRERKSLKVLDGMFDELGLDEEDLLVGDERSIAEKLEEFIVHDKEPLRLPEIKTGDTPFYKREER